MRKLLKKDRQHAFTRNTEAPPRSHFSRGKAVSVTYSECVFVVLVTQSVRAVLYRYL